MRLRHRTQWGSGKPERIDQTPPRSGVRHSAENRHVSTQMAPRDGLEPPTR